MHMWCTRKWSFVSVFTSCDLLCFTFSEFLRFSHANHNSTIATFTLLLMYTVARPLRCGSIPLQRKFCMNCAIVPVCQSQMSFCSGEHLIVPEPNVVVEWVDLLLRIRDISGLYLDEVRLLRLEVLSWLSQKLRKWTSCGIVSASSHYHVLPHPYKFIVY
jgi:hypothetical protein